MEHQDIRKIGNSARMGHSAILLRHVQGPYASFRQDSIYFLVGQILWIESLILEPGAYFIGLHVEAVVFTPLKRCLGKPCRRYFHGSLRLGMLQTSVSAVESTWIGVFVSEVSA